MGFIERFGGKMNGHNKDYWLQEAFRNLELALIGIREKNREHIEAAIEALNNYKIMIDNERVR